MISTVGEYAFWLAMLTITAGVSAILGGWFVRRAHHRDRALFVDELVRVHQQKLVLEREAAEWHRRYRAAIVAQRIDVYHHQPRERLPGDEWMDGGTG